MATTLKDSQVSIRLPLALKNKMETYATLAGRTKSHVAMEALGEYLDWRMPQIKELKAAVAAADAGDFASDDEAAAIFSRYTKPPVPRRPANAEARKRRA